MLNKKLYDAYIQDQIDRRNQGEDVPMLTRTQNEWLLWLFDEQSVAQIQKVGNMPTLFKDVFKFIKNG